MKKRQIEPSLAEAAQDVTSEEVADYLRANPDFFDGRDDLLLDLSIPHARGASVSLVERQVLLLRERNRALRGQLSGLLEAARENDATFARCRRLVLALLDASSGEQLLDNLESCLKEDFNCDFYRLFLYDDRRHQVNHWVMRQPRDAMSDAIGGLVASRNPVLGVLRDTELEYLFGADASKIGSAGIFPVRREQEIALLAIGSTSPTQFQSGMGTLFTDFIAETLARTIPAFTFR